MNTYMRLIIVLILSLIYGIIIAYDSRLWNAGGILIHSSTIIFIAAFILGIFEFLRFVFNRKDYNVKQVPKTFLIIFLILFTFLVFANFVTSKLVKEDLSKDTETYKNEVLHDSDEDKQVIGSSKFEFANDNNLYENYKYNYAIKFPEHFDLDYGIGKFSEVQATRLDSGLLIIVNVAETETKKILDGSHDKDAVSDVVVNEMLKSFREKNGTELMEQSFEKKGLTDVKLSNISSTNFNNRLFVKLEFKANAILDGEKHPTILIDYITFYYHNVYHFTFRCWESGYTDSWKNRIKSTMSMVLVSENISNSTE
jgi:hypothetical protein